MTRFKEHLKAIFDAYNGIEIDTKAAVELHSKTLLDLAKKELKKDEQSDPL